MVQNTAGYELPHTGGSGMVMFHLSGVMLMSIAIANLLIQKRKTKKSSY